jgi:hypothetical protein
LASAELRLQGRVGRHESIQTKISPPLRGLEGKVCRRLYNCYSLVSFATHILLATQTNIKLFTPFEKVKNTVGLNPSVVQEANYCQLLANREWGSLLDQDLSGNGLSHPGPIHEPCISLGRKHGERSLLFPSAFQNPSYAVLKFINLAFQ